MFSRKSPRKPNTDVKPPEFDEVSEDLNDPLFLTDKEQEHQTKVKKSDLLQLQLNFFRNDIPKLIAELKNINKNLERLRVR